MHRRDEPRLLLYALVLTLAVLVHLPALIGATVFMRPTEERLPEVRELEPIQLVEEPLDPADDPEQEATFVSLDKPEEETPPPEEARFLDRYNQQVEEESVRRREVGLPGTPSPPAPQRTPRPAQQQQAPPQGKPEAEAEPNALPELEPEAEAPLLEDDPEAPAARSDEGAAALEVKPPLQDTAPEREAPGKGKINLDPAVILPSLSNVGSGPQGTGGTPDYLRDVAEGDKDLLNRKESRYWIFFDRVRAAVARQWDPNSVYRANDPRGQIYGVEDRLTILHVTLKGDGSLHNLYVEKPSGLAFLDHEATRAMRVAQPFANPPEGLKDDQGLISFTFGFMFEIESRGGRIIRYSR